RRPTAQPEIFGAPPPSQDLSVPHRPARSSRRPGSSLARSSRYRIMHNLGVMHYISQSD
ncbi:hypothetical protein CVT26_007831, partial [Gymnopilus dilepis]